MSRDALDTELRKLALAIVKAAVEAGQDGKPPLDTQHDRRVETLKVAGNFASQAKRGKKSADDPEADDTMTAVQRRIAAAGQTEGHA